MAVAAVTITFFPSFAQKVLKTASGGRDGERDFGRETESDF